MINHEILFSSLAFFSELLGTLSGFGASTFFLPIAILLENYHLVLVLTAILHVFGNGYRILTFFKSISTNHLLKLCVPSIALSFLGSLLNPYVPIDSVKKILGLFLIIFSVYQLLRINKDVVIPFKASLVLIAISGFLTGLVGTGGALRGVGLMSMGLPHAQFIALSSFIDIGGDILRLAGYLYNGYMDWSHWFYIPIMAMMAYLGTYVAKRILNRIDQKVFYKIVSLFILISGLTLIFT